MKISFIGTIKKPPPRIIHQIEQQKPKNVNELLELLGYSDNHKPFIIATADGKRLKSTSSLTSDMEIELTVLVGGG